MILGNVTDVINSIAKAYEDAFAPYVQHRLAPILVKYLGDEHGKSDKQMVIGCLIEVVKHVPTVADAYFDDFF